jgi:hypothetical protein
MSDFARERSVPAERRDAAREIDAASVCIDMEEALVVVRVVSEAVEVVRSRYWGKG